MYAVRTTFFAADLRSPLLFVLAVDLLQSLLNKAKDQGILCLPLPLGVGTDFPIIQYLYDNLFVMQICPRQLIVLKALLHTYAESNGLKVNYSKSMMLALNVSEERIQILAETFRPPLECRILKMQE